jgi:hypothetical protein
MTITNEEEAQGAIRAICEYLGTVTGPPDDPLDVWEGEDKSAFLARMYCHLILEASTAHGAGGCLLCSS